MKKEFKIIVQDQQVSVIELNAEYTTEYVEDLLNQISDLQKGRHRDANTMLLLDSEIKDLQRQLDQASTERRELFDAIDEKNLEIRHLEGYIAELEEESYNKFSDLQDALEAIDNITKQFV